MNLYGENYIQAIAEKVIERNRFCSTIRSVLRNVKEKGWIFIPQNASIQRDQGSDNLIQV
jgi:hypothetical protein